ncbi:hypothetical protein NOK12_12770 [Nocardioides sp. OK12]|uniref:type IV pilus modification PilV family protein n=1 Tax=Nocardioides sp. OK12 TaxID=2758661 RepID=UPI0021C2AF79|nr:type II secretion system protein [Nocardioides sp. OK12]GHJ58759.1 hypothetical protein NOK12_12770 [Nocardioides sp. OK12]
MSPRTEKDAGFTLVEVVVAVGILMTLLVATLPQLVGGIRANDIARASTQAKALATSELERMRNLPFHVEPNAGDYIDLLDQHFHDVEPAGSTTCTDDAGRTVPPTVSHVGYVAAGAPRCSWEPAGAFYRTVRTSAEDPDLDGFVVTASTQFLDAATPPAPVAPPEDYDTTDVGRDAPVTGQVGITVAVLPAQGTDRRPITTYTQISRSYQTTTRLRATAHAVALEASTMLPGPTPEEGNAVSVSGALTDLDASLVAGSRVDLAAAGVTATAATEENNGTTRTALTAPPDVAPTWTSTGEGRLSPAGCLVACWGGGSFYGSWKPTTSDGLPGVGTPTAPVEVALKTPSAGGGYALRMGMGSGAVLRPSLGLANPVLRVRAGEFGSGIGADCSVGITGSGLRLASGGWAHTTAGPTGGANACAVARSAEVGVLPMAESDTDDPLPLIKVRVTAAAARCTVAGAGHEPDTTLTIAADLSYWNGSSYSDLPTFTEEGATTLPDPATLSVGGTPLSTWVESWSVATESAGITRVEAPGIARLEVPAVVSIHTVPLRARLDAGGNPVLGPDGTPEADPLSTLSVTVGSVACTAEDHR